MSPKIAAPSMHQRYNSVDSISTKPSMDDISVKEKSVSDTSFATLLRNSTFVQMGNPIGKVSFWPMYWLSWVRRLGYVLVNRFCYRFYESPLIPLKTNKVETESFTIFKTAC